MPSSSETFFKPKFSSVMYIGKEMKNEFLSVLLSLEKTEFFLHSHANSFVASAQTCWRISKALKVFSYSSLTIASRGLQEDASESAPMPQAILRQFQPYYNSAIDHDLIMNSQYNFASLVKECSIIGSSDSSSIPFSCSQAPKYIMMRV